MDNVFSEKFGKILSSLNYVMKSLQNCTQLESELLQKKRKMTSYRGVREQNMTEKNQNTWRKTSVFCLFIYLFIYLILKN